MKFDSIVDMKRLIVVFAFWGLIQNVFSQYNTGVKFNELVHDFGNVKEESERVSTVFSFTNISEVPLFIVKVETSCGCTTPEYTKDTILPGASGFVKAIFETRGRTGSFHKNLFVHFNKENYYQSLVITGYVVAEANMANKPKSYTTTYSNLALTSTIAEFPNLLSNQIQTYQIKAFNYMNYDIRIYELSELPPYLSIDLQDSLIAENDSIIITFTVDGSKINKPGEMRGRIGLLTDDPYAGMKYLHIYTKMKLDFSHLSKKELKNAPAFSMNISNPLDLGKHTAGEKFKYPIKITNTGKTDLDILSVVPNCSCITFQMGQTKIKPGETADLILIIDTVNLSQAGHFKYVSIYTNDPKNPEINLKVVFNLNR